MQKLPRITIVTGDGKGKTSTAMGRAVLAAWSGERVMVVQFLKGTGYTGELRAERNWRGDLKIKQFGAGCFQSEAIAAGLTECSRCGNCFRENRRPENRFAVRAFACAPAAAASEEWDLMVLDEIRHPINKGLLELGQVTGWVESVAGKVRLILTGRNMPQELLEIADEATECMSMKHPITRGIFGRRGSEY